MRYGLSIAAIDPQWIGIAAASAIVVVLIVILLVRRSKAGTSDAATKPSAATLTEASPAVPPPGTATPAWPGPDAAAASGAPVAPGAAPSSEGAAQSFLDQPLQRGFDGLGKPAGAQPALGTVVMPRDSRPVTAPRTAADPLAPQPQPPVPPPMDMGMDMGSLAPETPEATAAAAGVSAPDGSGAPAADSTSPPPPTGQAEGSAGTVPDAAHADGATGVPDAGSEAAAPLSEIIVTTNRAEVDLTDPDVRAMLEELVQDEIALAVAYREQGQTLDAILQLTEAEKACKALGDTGQAQRIKALLDELQS